MLTEAPIQIPSVSRGLSRAARSHSSGTRVTTRRSLVSSIVGVALTLASLECATRLYTFYQGRGFADDPKAFSSPFFTTEDWPAPYKNGAVYEFKDGGRLTAEEAHRSVVVVCLGGSTALSQNGDGKAYPRVLEGLLKHEYQGSPVRVMNAAGNGFGSAHALVNFSLQILTPDIKPDVIVVDHNLNDLTANYFGAETLPDYANKYMSDYFLAYPHKSGAASYLLRQSRLFRFLYYRGNAAGYVYDRAPDADYLAGAAFFERNLRSLAALAAANNVDVVFATQPTKNPAVKQLKSYQLYNDINKKVAAEFGDGLVDVANAVTEDRYFVDDLHYSPTGVDKVAQVFLPELQRVVAARLHRLGQETAGTSW